MNGEFEAVQCTRTLALEPLITIMCIIFIPYIFSELLAVRTMRSDENIFLLIQINQKLAKT